MRVLVVSDVEVLSELVDPLVELDAHSAVATDGLRGRLR